ncbi:methylated-DNA--[protein]-cysteine S-methyltransferase [Candidatus Bipolaricaulota bacterium]|nr:methylated-DNA--[protein]-cysteine S-methyltransferase [Candidatus Bipolaricaulota bacterium]
MTKRVRRLPERLYGSTIGWEGWTFRVISSGQGLRFLALSAEPLDALADKLGARILPDDAPNRAALSQVHEYLIGARRTFDLSLDLCGTVFQKDVWEALRTIPYGVTVSYGEIAERIAKPRAVRAVGQAVGANPVPIVIPCHRVIGHDGHLVGFGGGLPLKERLLSLEQGALDL